MDKQQFIAKHLKQATNQAYWLGAAIGLVFGAAIGYSLGSPQTAIIPLERGVEV